ncbi:MAG: flavodoxin domain-containing protein [Actinobacteria bacterium]|nr:flavodoxin domain-containing protein [Actinomycetota bacterium]MBU2686147.1 flavodoxin domain-containing protein [Actinomycetota bacterium]
MAEKFEAVRVSEHVHWVGAIDWDIRDFHGYSTMRGSTYNAYLVEGEDYVLIDTVKAPFREELMSRIASVTDPGDIRYIISNHSEMDHSGSLPRVIADVQPEKVYASPLGVKDLEGHYHMDGVDEVKDGQSLNLGGLEFSFIETRMIHWPDSMMTYLPADRLLFSQDGFGMHLATEERFSDEVDRAVMVEEGTKYFANILTPYAPVIQKLLARVEEMALPLDLVCPDHGPIWRGPDEFAWIVGKYHEWCAQEPTMKAVVTYDTMWGSTERMARAIEEGLRESGASPVVLRLRATHRSDVVMEVLGAGALLVGSPTINNTLFPTVADLLTYMKGLKFRNLVGAAFGSFGWSGEGAREVAGYLEQMKIEQVDEPLNLKFVPDDEMLEQCRALGRKVASRLKEVAGRE